MTSSERELGWRSYAYSWKGWIWRWLDLEEAQNLYQQVPQSWIDLLMNPGASTIRNLWAQAANNLPRFVDYLENSIIEVRIADSQIGYLLVYFLKDWRDLGPDGYEDGFMIAGMPTTEENIAQFEVEVGNLPNSMRTLWLTHGFVQRRDGTFITSLKQQQQNLVHAPIIYSARRDRWQEGRVLDCLAIANVIGEIVPSLSRPVGTLPWNDYLMEVMRWDDSMTESLRIHLDDFLADWTFSEWDDSGDLKS